MKRPVIVYLFQRLRATCFIHHINMVAYHFITTCVHFICMRWKYEAYSQMYRQLTGVSASTWKLFVWSFHADFCPQFVQSVFFESLFDVFLRGVRIYLGTSPYQVSCPAISLKKLLTKYYSPTMKLKWTSTAYAACLVRRSLLYTAST